jgi:Fic family protein
LFSLAISPSALVVEKGLTVGGRTPREHLEAGNHAKAFDRIVARARSARHATKRDALDLHALVVAGTLDEQAGRYRSVPVRISGSRVVLPNPRKVPDLMAAFGAWLAQGRVPRGPESPAARASFASATWPASISTSVLSTR